MRFHIEQVIRPLAQARIIEHLERGDGTADGGAPCEAGALSQADELIGLLVHLRIVEELQMCGDDVAASGASRLGYAREPRPHVGAGHFKSVALGHGTRAGFGDVDLAALDSRCAADREAADRGHCSECPSVQRRRRAAARRSSAVNGAALSGSALSGSVPMRGVLRAQCFLEGRHQACHGLFGLDAAGLDG